MFLAGLANLLCRCPDQQQNRIVGCLQFYIRAAAPDDMVQIVRNDFDRILNSAASCALITVEGAMPVLAEQLRTELEALHIGADLDMVIKVSYHPASEISFDDLCSLLTVIHEFAPQVNIVWGCGTDAKLAETDYSILLLIGTSAE